jgi:ubiquinone/menaquinone biosynthesis C-methylase UbiE
MNASNSVFTPSVVEKNTGAIYDHLFTAYSPKQFDDSVALFEKRHKLWGIPLEFFRGKVCLDAGCGGGRFSIALAKLSAKKVVGVDISEKAVEAARERAKERSLGNVEFQRASVLSLPFSDRMFDYVISSGVILLTPDPKKAFDELVRVLRPGGTLFLSVYGKYGLKWFVNDLFRYTVCQVIPFYIMEKLFALVGVPANKRYNTLDNLYTPYTKRFTETEIRRWLTDAGFENIRRVKFERYDYSTLRSRIIHGVGWIQMYADKKKSSYANIAP